MSSKPTTPSTRAVTAGARKILDERNTRKKAEENAQLLSNRIQHLKDEVMRASKRAQEANTRTKDIENLKVESIKRKELAKTIVRRVQKLEVKEEG